MKTNSFRFLAYGIFSLALGTGLFSCSSDNDDGNGGITICPTTPSPYIASVFEYKPAPGQFVNDLPKYEEGDTEEAMRRKVEMALVGEESTMITLGGYGGYVVFGFDHMIENKTGLCDFRVNGNAYLNGSEPGIIMVSFDANENGTPDDKWYEIAGSEYTNSTKDYTITYSKPKNESTTVEEGSAWILDSKYIAWKDNKGGEGFKTKNNVHKQSYYPMWRANEAEISFSGTLLPSNAKAIGSMWQLPAYAWGYADNISNTDNASAIDIDWAVDSKGNKANLKGINFVKVYTGVNQEAGTLGETSTEVSGAEDLHILKKTIATIK